MNLPPLYFEGEGPQEMQWERERAPWKRLLGLRRGSGAGQGGIEVEKAG